MSDKEDITFRLRWCGCCDSHEGADEIEALRTTVERLTAERDEMQGELRKAETECSMLRVECGVIAAERDEARRIACDNEAKHNSMMFDSPKHSDPCAIAESRGWDCFKNAAVVKTLKGVVVSKGKALPPKFELGDDDK